VLAAGVAVDHEPGHVGDTCPPQAQSGLRRGAALFAAHPIPAGWLLNKSVEEIASVIVQTLTPASATRASDARDERHLRMHPRALAARLP